MTEAPETISAIKLVGAKSATFLGGNESGPFDATEYVRADLLDARIAEAVAAALQVVAERWYAPMSNWDAGGDQAIEEMAEIIAGKEVPEIAAAIRARKP